MRPIRAPLYVSSMGVPLAFVSQESRVTSSACYCRSVGQSVCSRLRACLPDATRKGRARLRRYLCLAQSIQHLVNAGKIKRRIRLYLRVFALFL